MFQLVHFESQALILLLLLHLHPGHLVDNIPQLVLGVEIQAVCVVVDDGL